MIRLTQVMPDWRADREPMIMATIMPAFTLLFPCLT